MGLENTNRWSQLDVPAAHRPVGGPGHQHFGFVVDTEARDRAGVPGEGVQSATSLERPRTGRTVGRTADENVADLHSWRRRRGRSSGSRSPTFSRIPQEHCMRLSPCRKFARTCISLISTHENRSSSSLRPIKCVRMSMDQCHFVLLYPKTSVGLEMRSRRSTEMESLSVLLYHKNTVVLSETRKSISEGRRYFPRFQVRRLCRSAPPLRRRRSGCT